MRTVSIRRRPQGLRLSRCGARDRAVWRPPLGTPPDTRRPQAAAFRSGPAGGMRPRRTPASWSRRAGAAFCRCSAGSALRLSKYRVLPSAMAVSMYRVSARVSYTSHGRAKSNGAVLPSSAPPPAPAELRPRSCGRLGALCRCFPRATIQCPGIELCARAQAA
jgi:hypothetical protein